MLNVTQETLLSPVSLKCCEHHLACAHHPLASAAPSQMAVEVAGPAGVAWCVLWQHAAIDTRSMSGRCQQIRRSQHLERNQAFQPAKLSGSVLLVAFIPA